MTTTGKAPSGAVRAEGATKAYNHQPHCNAGARIPIGEGICSCELPIRIAALSQPDSGTKAGERACNVGNHTLTVTHIADGEEVVTGGEDGQAWVATFADPVEAKAYVKFRQDWSWMVAARRGRALSPPEPARGETCGTCLGHKQIDVGFTEVVLMDCQACNGTGTAPHPSSQEGKPAKAASGRIVHADDCASDTDNGGFVSPRCDCGAAERAVAEQRQPAKEGGEYKAGPVDVDENGGIHRATRDLIFAPLHLTITRQLEKPFQTTTNTPNHGRLVELLTVRVEGPWEYRWHGSGDDRGSHVFYKGEHVAFFGDQQHDAAGLLVHALNLWESAK
jgi:hypothetical protein